MESRPNPASPRVLRGLSLALVVVVLAVLLWNGDAETELEIAGDPHASEASHAADAPAADVETMAGKESASRRPLGELPAPSVPTGTVLLAMLGQSEAIAGTSWSFVPAGGDPQEAVERKASRAGSMTLPPGHWRVVAQDDRWIVEDPVFDLHEGERLTLWVRCKQQLRVRVESILGLAVANASVRWANLQRGRGPLDSAWAISALRWSEVVRTDRQGIAILDKVQGPGVRLGVKAHGYASRSILISEVKEEIRVTLVPSSTTTRHFRLVDAKTGTPVRSATAHDQAGVITCSESLEGTYKVAFADEDAGSLPIAISAPGYCTITVKRARLNPIQNPVGDPIALFRACRVVFTSQDRKHNGTIWPAIAKLPAQGTRPLIPDTLLLRAGRSEPLCVPQDAVVTFSAVHDQGASCQDRFDAQDESMEVPIVWGATEDGLTIHLRDRGGQRIHNAVATAFYYRSSIGRHIRARIGTMGPGEIRVPRIGEVRSVDLEAPGYARVRLMDYSNAKPESKRGAVTVTMYKAQPVEIVLQTGEGAPCAGLVIHVTARPIRIFPGEYQTGRRGFPTDHASWSRKRRTGGRVTTDGAGAAKLQLGKGKYSISFRGPGEAKFGFGHSGYWGGGSEIRVAGAERFVFTVPRMIFVTVVGFDAATRLPLSSIRVDAKTQNGGSISTKEGHRHELWIADSNQEVWVGSRGYAGQFYPVVTSGSQRRVEIRARLWPCQAGTLQIVDVPDALKGEKLWIRVARIIPNERVMNGYSYVHKLDASGRSSIVTAVGPTAKIDIGIQKINGKRWTFQPVQDIWAPGKTVVFRAVPWKPR